MSNPFLHRYQSIGLEAALDRFPDLALKPSRPGELVLAGELGFTAIHPTTGTVQAVFSIEICIFERFPAVLPRVRELAGLIPRTFHKLSDGSLCLGSPLQLWSNLRQTPTLLQFIETCIIPYLLGFVVFEQTGVMPFDELDHGARGLLDDYRVLTGATDDACCIALLNLLGTKRRIANKLPCPCGSRRRVGKCHNKHLNPLRAVACRAWFRGTASILARALAAQATPRAA